jgi:hypothetical protein
MYLISSLMLTTLLNKNVYNVLIYVSYNARKRVGGAVPVPETFQKRETAGNVWKRNGNISGKSETFFQLGYADPYLGNVLGNVSGPKSHVYNPLLF